MYRKGLHGWMKHIDFFLLDNLCLQIAFCIAYMLRHGFENPYLMSEYRNLSVVLFLINLVILFFTDAFKHILKRGLYKDFVQLLKQTFLLIVLVSFYNFAIHEGEVYSRIAICLTGAFFFILSYICRFLWKLLLKKKNLNSDTRSLLIVTNADIAEQVIDNVEDRNFATFRLAGVALLDQDRVGETVRNLPVVACGENIDTFVCHEWVDEVLICLPDDVAYPSILIEHLKIMGVTVHIKLADSFALAEKGQIVERLGNFTVLTSNIRYATPGSLFVKRLMDILGGLVGCIMTGILTVFVAPFILIQSPGPLFFSQIRVGKNGKPFKIYKFRTMYLDAEERKKELMAENRVKDGMMFKVEFDNRIIGCRRLENGKVKKGVGGWLRTLSIDEFPQFFNVLKGNMSLVGTRPPTMDEWEKYSFHHRARLAMKPGITGMWQVSGRSNITDFEEVVKLDLQYISEWNIGLDIKILFKTVMVVFKKEGSM